MHIVHRRDDGEVDSPSSPSRLSGWCKSRKQKKLSSLGSFLCRQRKGRIGEARVASPHWVVEKAT
jgi:hypothetical protein